MRTRSGASRASGTLVRFPVRRRSERVRRALAVASAAGLLAVGFGTWAAVSWRVREIRVMGQETLGSDRIVRVSRLEGGERILLTRMGAVADRVKRLPGVDAAWVERDLPHTVVIRVDERTPLVSVEGANLAAGADGLLFRVPEDHDLPVVEDPGAGRAAAGRSLSGRWKRVLDDYGRFPFEIRRRAARLAFKDTGFTITLRDGVEIIFGRVEQMEAKASAAEAVLRHAAQSEDSLAYVDVRVPRAPVGKPWSDPPATSSGHDDGAQADPVPDDVDD